MSHARLIVISVIASSLVSSAVAAIIVSAVTEPKSTRPAAVVRSDADPRPAASESETARQVYEDASPAVVHVSASVQSEPDFLGNRREGIATGSGFVIDDAGHVITNAHVVDGASKVSVSFPGEKEYETEVIGIDASSDLAVLKIKAADDQLDDLTALDFADSSKARVGDFVIAIGNPLSLDYTATTGIVSALDREISAPNGFTISQVLQTDAAINQGNSGGPLLDSNGNVLGVNSQIATSGTSSGSIGIGFAIPANTVADIATQLIEDGAVKRPYLGVAGFSLTEGLAEAINAPVDSGVMLMRVFEGSPAEKAGLVAGDTQVSIGEQQLLLGGDIITQIDDEKVESMVDIGKAIEKSEVGDTVKIIYHRDGNKRTASVKLAQRAEGQ